MKTSALSVVLLLSAGVMSAQTPAPAAPAAPANAKTTPAAPADITIADPSKAAPVDPKAAPDKAKTDAKKVEKKEEKLGKILGIEIARPNGTWLGLEVAGGSFKLTFYDKKKKPMKVDVTRGTARWPNLKSTTGDNRTVLNNNGDGKALFGSKPVVPPLIFNVYITLLVGDGEDAKAVENYVVPFHG